MSEKSNTMKTKKRDLPVVEQSVGEVVPRVFENEEECDL